MINGKIILTSLGMETIWGLDQMKKNLPKEEIENATILLIALPEDELEDDLVFWSEILGFEEENITVFRTEDAEYIKKQYYDVIYVSGSNTFAMLDYLKKNRLLNFIRECVEEDACYIGCGAGAWVAGKDVESALEVEENTVGLTDFKALGLFAGIAIPGYDEENAVKKQVFMDAIASQKYGYVATIGMNEAEVMYKGLHKTLSQEETMLLRDISDQLYRAMCSLPELLSKIKKEAPGVGVGMKIPVTDAKGKELEATLLSVIEHKEREYAIYSIENPNGTCDILASRVLQDEDGMDYLCDLNSAEDRLVIEKFLDEIVKRG